MPDLTCATVILARGGSKGVPGKNMAAVGGVSLVGRAVRAAVQATNQATVYVSTDDADIAAQARLFGAYVIDRPADISGDTTSSEARWLHALPRVRADLPDLTHLVFVQCTSPFITGTDIDACLTALRDADAACALSVVEAAGQRFFGPVALCPVDQPSLKIDSLADLELATALAHTYDHSRIAPDALTRVTVLVMDFDGMHTDNLVTTDLNGGESVTTSRDDGMGAELGRRTDIARLIVSKERNPVVLARAAKLGIKVMGAVDDKVAALDTWLGDRGLGWDQMLYVDYDINDAPAMQKAGLAACPSDAHRDVLGLAQWILPHPGGRGALRYLCDVLVATHDRA